MIKSDNLVGSEYFLCSFCCGNAGLDGDGVKDLEFVSVVRKVYAKTGEVESCGW